MAISRSAGRAVSSACAQLHEVIRKVLEQMAEQGQVMVDGDMETGLSIFIIAP